MQLFNVAFSPYASRCRVQIYHKNLPVEIVAPPGGLGSAQLREKNPIGKIPVLDLGDKAIAESWAIMEYLEAKFPSPPMWATDEFERARLRELVRFCDLQLAPAMFPMFRALRGAVTADAAIEGVSNQQTQLQILETLLARKHSNLALDLADAALLPVVYYARILARHFGKSDCLAALPACSAWWQRTSAVPAAAKVLGEMDTGLRAAIPVLFPAN